MTQGKPTSGEPRRTDGLVTETLGKPDRIRWYSDQGCGDNTPRVRNQNLAEISVNEKPKLFSWNSRDRGRNIFHLKSGANLGPKEEKNSFLVEQDSYRKRSHLLTRVGEASENEIEKPQGEKPHHQSKLHSVSLNDGLSRAIFKNSWES